MVARKDRSKPPRKKPRIQFTQILTELHKVESKNAVTGDEAAAVIERLQSPILGNEIDMPLNEMEQAGTSVSSGE